MLIKDLELQEHVEKCLSLIPVFGKHRALFYCNYMLKYELDREFIEELATCLTATEQEELKYAWNIKEGL